MRQTFVFYSLLTILAATGLWGLMHSGVLSSNSQQESHPPASAEIPTTKETARDSRENVRIDSQNSGPVQTSHEMDADDIQALIRAGGYQQAANTINERYSHLSSTDLEQLKLEFLKQVASAGDGQQKSILIAASSVFDELNIWKLLANIATREADWQLAFDSQLKASQLENDPIELNGLLKQLVISSSYLRSAYEKNDDQLSIKTLYQQLADLHPQFGRFQLELANSHARLGDIQSATTLYDTLSYDPEFSDIAQQALARIDESLAAPSKPVARTQPPEEAQRRNDIVVPLIAAGSSFLVDTGIDRQRSRLLLDTGASITALSSALIERLDLTPTGQSIRLSTANGLTRARLYRVNRLSLGRLTLRNMIVAEIDLGRRGSFEGLLGTDALNQFKSQYSYVIDNQKNALIFRAR